jgi:hypothetical protein
MANIVIGEHQIVVDNDMYPILDKYKWCILKNKKINYAQAKIGRKIF